MAPAHRRALRVRIVAASFGLVAAAALASCSSGTADGSSPAPTPVPTGTVRTLAVLAPLTGNQADAGRGVLQSVRGTVDARTADLARAGITVKVLALDDRGQPSVGQQQATRLTDDPSVVAVIGSVSSLLDEGVQPILNTAGLAMLAPGGGAPWLTMRGQPPRRPFATYFRLSARDADQGTAAAVRALREGDRRAVVIEDGTADHASISTAFASTFGARPATSVVREVVDPATTGPPPPALVRRIASVRPQTVLLSVAPEHVAAIRAALTAARVRPRYVTTMPLDTTSAVTDEPDAWTGVTVTTVGALPQTLPGRPTLPPVTPGPGAGEPVEPGLYGAAAADAATLVIDGLLAPAVARAVPDATLDPSSSAIPQDANAAALAATSLLRSRLVRYLDRASIQGATGPVSFDGFGDVRTRPVGFFVYDGTDWVPQPSVIVRPGT